MSDRDTDHEGWKPEKPRMTEAKRAELKGQHREWIRHILLSALVGMALGVMAAAILLKLDFNGLGSMLGESRHRFGYTALLVIGFAYTASMVSMGIGITLKAVKPELFGGNRKTCSRKY
jgi:hypothetical protein